MDAPVERSVFCLICIADVIFTEYDVKEREEQATDACSAPQIVDYVVCTHCGEIITLGLPRFRSEPGPADR